jgi:hypothetical protein
MEMFQQIRAVHPRHEEIHHDRVEVAPVECRGGFLAIGCRCDRQAGTRAKRGKKDTSCSVVIDYQHIAMGVHEGTSAFA